MHNDHESTTTFTFGQALYEASRRFDDLSQGKQEDYRRSFGRNQRQETQSTPVVEELMSE